MQTQDITRALSARLIEYLKPMKNHRVVCDRAKDVACQDFLKEHDATLDALWNDPEQAVALEIRNQLTGHIGLNRIRGNIKKLADDRQDMSPYLHREDGNSFYALGEDVAHIAAFETSEAVNDWSDRVMKTRLAA